MLSDKEKVKYLNITNIIAWKPVMRNYRIEGNCTEFARFVAILVMLSGEIPERCSQKEEILHVSIVSAEMPTAKDIGHRIKNIYYFNYKIK